MAEAVRFELTFSLFYIIDIYVYIGFFLCFGSDYWINLIAVALD